jgi:uncharacterized protein YqfB (UPF0267 family)
MGTSRGLADVVAYSFKGRFAAPILAGTKTQTIRAQRKRHARAGEDLQLYTGMRTKQCKLIRVARCTDVSDVFLSFLNDRVESWTTGTAWTTPDELQAFAEQDGFANWKELRAFWGAEHPGFDQFEGVLIRWAP